MTREPGDLPSAISALPGGVHRERRRHSAPMPPAWCRSARRTRVFGRRPARPAVEGSAVPDPQSACLDICITCRDRQTGAAGGGERLFKAASSVPAPEGVTVRPLSCLANCDRGCSAALTMPGKWSVLLGRLHAPQAADLLIYAHAYAQSANGMLMPSRRPESLRNVVLGRVPGAAMNLP